MTDLRPWKPITYSCSDTPNTLAQIDAHNSVYDGLKKKRKIVYHNTCPSKPKTS